jgi:hypothetical protein
MSDEFNFDGKPSRARGAAAPMNMWDMLSILVLILTACVVFYFGFIFLNPNSQFNFLPPGGPESQFPSATPTFIQLQPTWTASPTLVLTPTNTLRPTFTSLPTNTPFSLVPPTRTPRPTNTPRAPFTASVSNVESTVIHPELACNWAGIGGTVVDNNGSHVIGVVVVLRGSLDGKQLDQPTVSGINKEYGPSGFEFVLGNAPVATNKTLFVQLVDQSNLPLSDPIAITTSTDCAKNLVLVRFRKTR